MVEHDIAVEQQLIDEFLESAESPVELSVAAQSDRLPIIRAVVESTLYLDDWTVDDVADVKLGVDEICSQLIAVSEAGRRLTVTIRPGRLGVVGQIEGSTTGLDLDTAGFGWRVVETVTDTQTLTYVDSGGDRRVTVRFAKRRTAL